ncbi:hypothetical protein J1G44_16340 [Cellulomonas sp. zg-ZUI199]|uniref:DUF4178 domain-containing protein n=1 Tax=Cellulomonas wangleii TaxID=2816956 RepID=A0ABX8D7C4_9CELL|nr:MULTISPECIES: hypothetical protein [Cellulomonas]MBO0901528.1 hypothetical protein [Cellulomonas sp. zg-ZUI22]MBO0926048.1 hypothetical protein [Cellulomonas wangleii]QVI63339.1 hypothetical protein KG103_05475 [Cellulomonas wangleii]
MLVHQPVPRTRVRLGRTLGRRTGWQATARGFVCYRARDAATGRFSLWEEWHLRDGDDADHRLAYTYGYRRRTVTLSYPVDLPERLDPATLRAGEDVTVTLDGRRRRLQVARADVAEVLHVLGAPRHPLTVGDRVAHAELRAPDVVLTVQDAGDGVVDVHRGAVLEPHAQRQVLGRDVRPRMNRFLVAGGAFAGFVLLYNALHACLPDAGTAGAAGAASAVVAPVGPAGATP